MIKFTGIESLLTSNQLGEIRRKSLMESSVESAVEEGLPYITHLNQTYQRNVYERLVEEGLVEEVRK